MLALDIKTTDDYILFAEKMILDVKSHAERLRNKADLTVKGLGQLFAIMQDCDKMIEKLYRVKGRYLSVTVLQRLVKRWEKWCAATNRKINTIYYRETFELFEAKQAGAVKIEFKEAPVVPFPLIAIALGSFVVALVLWSVSHFMN